MLAKNLREMLLVLFWLGVATVIKLMISGDPPPLLFSTVVLLTLLLGLTLSIQREVDTDTVDIWTYQQRLMLASSQDLPGSPQVTHSTVLYTALVLEEVSETIKELAHCLATSLTPREFSASRSLYLQLSSLHKDLHAESATLRHHLARAPANICMHLNREAAKHLLDGFTDTAVVVAGWGLATGMPVREAYREVMASNLSKINPRTGVIDKDESGKWVKGSNYQPPDLTRVLEEAWVEQ